jgi:hypothetical protein
VLVWLPTASIGWLGAWLWAPDLAQLLAVLVAVLSTTAALRLADAALPERPAPSGVSVPQPLAAASAG